MDGSDPSEIDVTIDEPCAIARVVADALVGRCVRLTWSSGAVEGDVDARVGVSSAAVEVVGCCLDEVAGPPMLVCMYADDDEFVAVPWSDLLCVGRRLGGDVAPTVRARLLEASGWFGHTVEITTRDGRRLVGLVIGFEYDRAVEGDHVEVLIVPRDHVRHPEMNEYAVPMNQLDTVLDWGA